MPDVFSDFLNNLPDDDDLSEGPQPASWEEIDDAEDEMVLKLRERISTTIEAIVDEDHGRPNGYLSLTALLIRDEIMQHVHPADPVFEGMTKSEVATAAGFTMMTLALRVSARLSENEG